MVETTRVSCPQCGMPMNRHAEKVDYRVEPSAADSRLGGAVMEIHGCPNPKCRFVLERPAK